MNSTMTTLIYIICLLVIGVVAEDRSAFAHSVCGAYGHKVIEGFFANEVHLLCLKLVHLGSTHLTSHGAALLLDPEALESHNSIQAFPLKEVTMAYGFPIDHPASGSAEGYIGADQHFYGVLHIGNRTLHADPHGTDDPTESFGVFENDFLAAPMRARRDHAQAPPCGHNFPFSIDQPKPVAGVARARICDLLLLADKEFFEQDAHASLRHVVQRMVHAVAQADIIFRNADFDEDGVPDNIGFSVKYIVVLTSNETNTRVFGDLLSQKVIDGRNYLMRFARLRRLSEVCLGVAFSGHAFQNRTLGLSFTSIGGGLGGAAGGLCDRRVFGRSFNTLALAHATADAPARVPERVAALTLSHELGHSFGAHHDNNYPNPECQGYLMGAQSPVAEDSRHFEFSLCSKRLIAAKLQSMSYCLSQHDRPYCGNGIVEEGEACDCGMPSHCSARDSCCTPRAGGVLVYEEGALHKEGCSVAPTARCHPSQGLCCNTKCEYADLSKSGIDCTVQDRECLCGNSTVECHCGLGGRCMEDRSCHAAECALLGLRECQCPNKGTGGAISGARMCGICCRLEPRVNEREGLCVGAEFAAADVLARGGDWPELWPGPTYSGPNVTVHVCKRDDCRTVDLRAWHEGQPCVTRNQVGVCTIRGVCKPWSVAPRSNLYPEIMSLKLKAAKFSVTSKKDKAILLNFLAFVLLSVVK